MKIPEPNIILLTLFGNAMQILFEIANARAMVQATGFILDILTGILHPRN